MDGERRTRARTKTRLRPGKLLDEAGGFVADCAILDRSDGGARVRLYEPIALPEKMSLLDESERARRSAECIWTRGDLAGLRWDDTAERLESTAFLSLAGPYYAVR